jgi:Transcriptional regulatory protein, C terminal
MDLLITLAEHGGDVVSTSTLMAKAWPNMAVEESNLRMQITLLRKALADGDSSARYIVNVPGRGYRLEAPPKLPNASTTRVFIPRRSDQTQNLPRRVSRVFGREGDVTTLIRVLESERFVTILGPGGIGKTTVALQVAEVFATNHAHGVCYIDLSAAREDALAPSAVAAALGLPVTSADPTPNLISFLQDKSVLLVFDTCEPVIGGAASVAEALLASAPGVRLLATSREPLRADGERRYRLSPWR